MILGKEVVLTVSVTFLVTLWHAPPTSSIGGGRGGLKILEKYLLEGPEIFILVGGGGWGHGNLKEKYL